ncbi:MAG: NAD(P)H-dependent oxidoreductase [Pseudomonadota bacterium]
MNAHPPLASSASAAPALAPAVGLDTVLVLVAHPALAQSVVNKQLLRAAGACGAPVEVRDLYALYPDYLIDVAAEQTCLQRARLVVWQHPIQWYHMPALMKLWVDEVLTDGWAYGAGGAALHGKDLWLVASTGGPADSYHPQSYNRYAFEAFLPAYEQTAALCGMRFLPPMVLHDARRVQPEDLAIHQARYVERLRHHPAWPEIQSPDLNAGLRALPASARAALGAG